MPDKPEAPATTPDAISDQPQTARPSDVPVVGTHPVAPTGLEPPAMEAPVRVCPKCSVQERTSGEFCPHCGARYVRKRRFGKRTKITAAVVFGALVVGGATTGVVLKVNHDHRVTAAKKHKAAEAATAHRQAEAAAAAKSAEQEVQRAERASLVKSLQRSVTKDAQKDVADGLLDGTVLRSDCTPAGADSGSGADDLTVSTASYECLAVTKDNADGTASGYRFSANVNFDDGTYSWHLGG